MARQPAGPRAVRAGYRVQLCREKIESLLKQRRELIAHPNPFETAAWTHPPPLKPVWHHAGPARARAARGDVGLPQLPACSICHVCMRQLDVKLETIGINFFQGTNKIANMDWTPSTEGVCE